MSDQEQKPDNQDVTDDIMAEALSEADQPAENTPENEGVEQQAAAESSEQNQDDQSSEDTAEGAENQVEQPEEPATLEGHLESRAGNLNRVLDERERKLLSFVDQGVIHIEYYKEWVRDANDSFRLRVLLDKRKKKLKKSA